MQTPEPQITTFTADQINRWLNQGETIPGLTQAVIAPARAWAILHNPYIKPEDHVAAALHLNNPDGTQNLVAYTAAFPEIIQNRRYCGGSEIYQKVEFFHSQNPFKKNHF